MGNDVKRWRVVANHRGASGYLPEHTIAAYSTSFYMHSDFIEPDVVFTKDGYLVCVHQPYLSSVTNIAQLPQFMSRKKRLIYEGKEIEDWFTFDFTLAELKTLKVK